MRLLGIIPLILIGCNICFGQIDEVLPKNNIYVFIVGISEYESEHWKRKTPEVGLGGYIKEVTSGLAEEFDEKFVRKVFVYDSIHETSARQLDTSISNELRTIKETGEASMVLFFFIGHGKYKKGDDFYLATSNVRDEGIDDGFRIVNDYLKHIERFLEGSYVITFIDACESGNLSQIEDMDTMQHELKQNKVMHYMLTSTINSAASYGATFSKSILRFLQDVDTNDTSCLFSFKNDNLSSTLRPYLKEIYKEQGISVAKADNTFFMPIHKFDSDRFCLDSFKGIKGAAVVHNNTSENITYSVLSEGEDIANQKMLKPGGTDWFFGYLGKEYTFSQLRYNPIMKEYEAPTRTFQFTEDKPSVTLFVDENNINRFSLSYINVLEESALASQTIQLDESIVNLTLAEAQLYRKLYNIRNQEGYAESIDSLLRNPAEVYVAQNWSRINNNYYFEDNSGERREFKSTVRGLMAEAKFAEANVLLHQNYLFSGDTVSRNLNMAFTAATMMQQELSEYSNQQSEFAPAWGSVNETESNWGKIYAIESSFSSKGFFAKLLSTQMNAAQSLIQWMAY